MTADKARIKKESKAKAGNPWEKAIGNVEPKEGGYKGMKDVTRMFKVMMSRQEDLKKKGK
jgi:hypothetical protein